MNTRKDAIQAYKIMALGHVLPQNDNVRAFCKIFQDMRDAGKFSGLVDMVQVFTAELQAKGFNVSKEVV